LNDRRAQAALRPFEGAVGEGWGRGSNKHPNMFEDLKQPPDIFAETDKTENIPPPFRPPQPPAAAPAVPPLASLPPQPPVSPPHYEGGGRGEVGHSFNWKPLVVVLAAVVVIALGAWLSTRILGSQTPVTENLSNVANNAAQEQPETNQANTAPVVETEVIPEPVVEVDTDKDGLSDAREAELGTSPTNTDTDDDGLFDREEVEVYKTDPLNPDTDGDSYRDGDEVKGGYNPNGAGKLFEVPGGE